MKSKLFLAIGLSSVLFSFFTACQREVVTDPQASSGLAAKTEHLLAEQFSSYESVRYDQDALYEKLQGLAEGATADIVSATSFVGMSGNRPTNSLVYATELCPKIVLGNPHPT